MTIKYHNTYILIFNLISSFLKYNISRINTEPQTIVKKTLIKYVIFTFFFYSRTIYIFYREWHIPDD